MHSVVFSRILDLRAGLRALPCHMLACKLHLSCLQLSAVMIFADHGLRQNIALVTIFTVCLLCWFLWITASVTYFANLSAQLFPPLKGIVIMVGTRLGQYLHWISFSVTGLAHGHLQGWFLLTELPWNLPAVQCLFVGTPTTFDCTSSQARPLMITLLNK